MLNLINPDILPDMYANCLDLSQQVLPQLLGRLWVDKVFKNDSIADMKLLINNIKDAYQQILDENTWLDSATKTHAKKKLSAIIEHIAFPDFLLKDSELIAYY